jgi:TRAP-type C4-dicarboxylate transport system permease small subunit
MQNAARFCKNFQGHLMRLFHVLAQACAVLAGVVLVAVTLLTVTSVIGREFGQAITGDFELVGVAAGAAVALFMPWCQVKRGHIIVDFFTAGTSKATQNALDRVGCALMAAVMAVLAWRTTLGGMNAFSTNEGSMMLGFPIWITYAFIVPPLVLCALIAAAQSAGLDADAQAGAAA